MILPIDKHKEEIIQSVLLNKVTIVAGETGSGKTSMIPQILCDSKFTEEAKKKGLMKKIGITQPRRMAAISIASFVAKQLNYTCGKEVGYKIRWDNSTSEGTIIKFMTDGILLREMQLDPDLNEYSIIMIDEAHERSLNMDLLIGLVKDLLKRRDDIRIIISSATIEEKKFSAFFDNAPIIRIKGNMFDVDIVYDEIFGRLSPESYYPGILNEKIIATIKEIMSSSRKGNILVFLTGEEDIDSTIKAVQEKIPSLYCLPLYGNMTFEEQMKVFQPSQKQMAIFSTNIAETSVTIEGIVYVIDSGFVKQTDFNNETGIGSLKVVEISQASAKQRAGRAGRTQPGICFRLYSEENLSQFDEFTRPEIERSNLFSVILQMKIMGINDIENFSFVDSPKKEAIHSALEGLILLGALNRNNGVTEIGKKMAKMPVDPRFSRMIIAAEEKYGCLDQVLTVVAAMSARGSIFWRPRSDDYFEKQRIEATHRAFKNNSSDFLTFLNVFEQFVSTNDRKAFCQKNYLNSKTLWEMIQIKKQLIGILKGVKITSSTNTEKIAKAIGSGLVQNICKKGGYRHQYLRGTQRVFIHPGSSLFSNEDLSWIVASEIRETSKAFAINCCEVKKEWIEEFAPQACRQEIQYIYWDKEKGTVRAVQKTFYNGWELSRIEKIFAIDSAKNLQAEKIAQAEKNGWLKLSFNRRDGLFWECRENKIYRPSFSAQVDEGRVYYCSIDSSDNDLFFKTFQERIVVPEFEVFDFEKP